MVRHIAGGGGQKWREINRYRHAAERRQPLHGLGEQRFADAAAEEVKLPRDAKAKPGGRPAEA